MAVFQQPHGIQDNRGRCRCPLIPPFSSQPCSIQTEIFYMVFQVIYISMIQIFFLFLPKSSSTVLVPNSFICFFSAYMSRNSKSLSGIGYFCVRFFVVNLDLGKFRPHTNGWLWVFVGSQDFFSLLYFNFHSFFLNMKPLSEVAPGLVVIQIPIQAVYIGL